MLVVIVIISALLTLAMPKVKTYVLHETVRSARRQVTTHLARGRATAVFRGCRAVLHLDPTNSRVWITACSPQGAGIDTVGTVDNFQSHFGVVFTSDGDSVLFTPQGVAMASSSIAMTFTKDGWTENLAITPVGRPIW
jgi:Tfp pilus assembly protein FimT